MREMVLVVAIWVQLSPVFTHIVLESFEPFILHITKKIPSIDIGFTSTLDVIAFWLEKRGLSSYYVSILKGFLTEASTLVAVLFFCFTPTPIASIGVVIVCMLIPLTRSADILTQLKYSKSKKTEATLEPLILFLLHYWVCLALVWLARLYILSPWPSVLLITCLWLQNSYFKGASRLVKEARALTIMLVERNAQQVIALVEGEDDDVSGKALQTPVATPSSAKGRSLRDSEEKISPIAVDADDATGIKSMSELSSAPLSSTASTVRKRRSTRKKFTSPDGKDAD